MSSSVPVTLTQAWQPIGAPGNRVILQRLSGIVIVAYSTLSPQPADMLGVVGLGIGAGRDWQENDKWWCSEAVANIVSASGLALMDWANIHTVTPKDNWLWPQNILQTSKVQ